MATTAAGNRLARDIRLNIKALQDVCQGMDEQTASRAPSGRWSPKEILSHLWGPEGGHKALFEAFLNQETPAIDLEVANPFFAEKRAAMRAAQLLAAVEQEYAGIAAFAVGLSEEQLSRQARIPQLKESPLGEYPTLEAMLDGLGNYHLQSHIDHLREILQELAAK